MVDRDEIKGLRVKVTLWPPETCAENLGVENTRLWIRGRVSNVDTGIEPVLFNNPEELIAILNKWNLIKWGVEP